MYYLWEWRVSNPKAPFSSYRVVPKVTLIDFFANKTTSLVLLGVLFVGIDQVLLEMGLYSLLTYALLNLMWDPWHAGHTVAYKPHMS